MSEQGWRSEFAGRVEGARPKRSQTKAWNAKQNRRTQSREPREVFVKKPWLGTRPSRNRHAIAHAAHAVRAHGFKTLESSPVISYSFAFTVSLLVPLSFLLSFRRGAPIPISNAKENRRQIPARPAAAHAPPATGT